MTSKRIFSALISTALIAGSIPSVYAAGPATTAAVERAVTQAAGSTSAPLDESKVQITKDKAKEIAAQFLIKSLDMQMDEKKYQARADLRKDYGPSGQYVWEINWDKSDEQKNTHITVSINGQNGKIIRLYKYEYSHNGEQPLIASITEEQAKEVAEAFIHKAFPEEAKDLVPIQNEKYRYMYGGRSPSYAFGYNRQINGIPFDSNSITIEVDGKTGTVASFNFNWDYDLQLPTSENIISADKADQIYTSETKMKLQYMAVRDNTEYPPKTPKVKLVYMAETAAGGLLDAQTGKITNYYTPETKDTKTKDLSEAEKEQVLKNTAPAEKNSGEIDSKKAETIVNNLIKEFLGQAYTIENLQYEENYPSGESQGKAVWTAYFSKESQIYGPRDGGNITIDATTGVLLLLSTNYYPDMEQEKSFDPVITWDQAYDKAIQAIAKYFPEKLKEIETKQTYTKQKYFVNDKEMPESRFYFNFPRLVNNIQYPGNTISVEIDLPTGNITSLQCTSWNDKTEFPSIQDPITEEDALKIFFENNTPVLTYLSVPKNPDKSDSEQEIKLAYRLQSQANYPFTGYVDAFTGNLINFDGTEINGQNDSFKDKIKGHWAENQLSILAYQNIIDSRTFEMDKTVTLAEFIKMVASARGIYNYGPNEIDALKFTNITKDSDIYSYLQLAVKYGLIENTDGEFDGSQAVTREKMAEILIKFLGYDTLAQAKDIFQLTFEDADEISPQQYGYVAIGKGLDIFAGSNGKFRPKDNTTMVEAAVTIYNALGKIKSMR